MPAYNKTFELTPDDLDLIETSLRDKQRKLSGQIASGEGVIDDCPATEQLRETHELLGRLHNQKKFFRPKSGAYIGG